MLKIGSKFHKVNFDCKLESDSEPRILDRFQDIFLSLNKHEDAKVLNEKYDISYLEEGLIFFGSFELLKDVRKEEKHTVIKTVTIPIRFFDFLHNKVCEEIWRLEGTCFLQYGLIEKVDEPIAVVNNCLSNTGDFMKCAVKFKAKILKPAIGESYNAIISTVFKHGIICEIGKSIMAMIPTVKLKEYLYSDGTFVKKKVILKVGEKIRLTITELRYENMSYSCIASLN